MLKVQKQTGRRRLHSFCCWASLVAVAITFGGVRIWRSSVIGSNSQAWLANLLLLHDTRFKTLLRTFKRVPRVACSCQVFEYVSSVADGNTPQTGSSSCYMPSYRISCRLRSCNNARRYTLPQTSERSDNNEDRRPCRFRQFPRAPGSQGRVFIGALRLHPTCQRHGMCFWWVPIALA